MKLKDLTKEQAIEIVLLIYPFSADVKSDYEFHYQPYDPTWYEDAREYVRVSFKGITFGDTVDDIILEINSIFDCWLYYSRKDGLHTIPNRNQHAAQKKFIEWGAEPDYTKL